MKDTAKPVERRFYLVVPGSPIMTIIERAEVDHRAFRIAMDLLKKEIGARDLWTMNGNHFQGATFDGEPPDGWRKAHRYCVPNKRTKAGRALAQRLKALPQGVSAWYFSDRLGADYTYHGDGFLSFTTYERLAGAVVLSVPQPCTIEPPGCVPMKMSEYWVLREAAESSPAGPTSPRQTR